MLDRTMTTRVETLRAQIAGEHDNPAELFDIAVAVVEDLKRCGQMVPADLRELVAALEAEVVEEFYDNLPV